MSAPRCVCLLEAKSCEDEVDYSWAGCRGMDNFSLDFSRILCGEDKMGCEDENQVLVLYGGEWVDYDGTISTGEGCGIVMVT